MARSAPKVVGLDIGTSGVRAVQLKRSRRDGTYTVVRAAALDLPRGAIRNGEIVEPDVVSKTLKRLWRAGRFSTRKVVFGLADAGVLTRQIDLPWMPPDDFRRALKYQVNDALPVDLTTVELDYHVLGEVQRTDDLGQPAASNTILVVAANSASVGIVGDVVRRARLEPVGADSSAFALIRAVCQGRLPEDDSVQAIADLGADQLSVVIHAGGQPRFIRTIANLGGETATAAVAERLRVTEEDAERLKRSIGLNGPAPVVAPIAESSVFGGLVEEAPTAVDPQISATVETLNPWATSVISEIRNSLDYFAALHRSVTVSSLVIAGRTVQLDGLLERMATQIPLPMTRMDPLAGLPAAQRVARHRESDARLAVATGLAMRAAS